MIERREPSAKDLRVFGYLLLLFFGGLGAWIRWRSGTTGLAVALLWGGGGFLSLLYWVLPPLRRSIYLGWMTLVFPIGWTVSHIVVGALYYLLLTPFGLLMRLFGHDPMRRGFRRDAESYWIARPQTRETARYFRQY